MWNWLFGKYGSMLQCHLNDGSSGGALLIRLKVYTHGIVRSMFLMSNVLQKKFFDLCYSECLMHEEILENWLMSFLLIKLAFKASLRKDNLK